LKKVAKEVGLDLRGAYLNLDGGFDSTDFRQPFQKMDMRPAHEPSLVREAWL